VVLTVDLPPEGGSHSRKEDRLAASNAIVPPPGANHWVFADMLYSSAN
jgi:hypothetical protein